MRHQVLVGAAVAALAGSAVTVNAQDPIVFDSGYVNTVLFNAAVTRLGFSSGSLPSAGFTQRWTAQAFTLAQATHVTRLDPEGFVPAGSEIQNIGWVIFRRNAGNPAPTAADQVAAGVVPYPGTIADDPRYDPVTNPNPNLTQIVAPIAVDLNLPAGNYYLTVYGDTAVTPGADANFAWFTNAQLDPTLTPPNTPIVISDANGVFTWRSTAFPTPGFQRYTTAAIAIDPAPTYGPNPQDPQYLYNCAFQIRGTAGGAVCYPDCNQDHALNVNDFICFQGAFAANNLPAADCNHDNTLNVNDFICFQSAFAAGCSQL